MKNSLKLILTLTSLALLASPVLRADEPTAPPAGKPDRPEGRPDRREGWADRREEMRENAKKMAAELNLTADQQARVEAIHKQTGEALQALRDDPALTPEQRREKARALRKSTEEQVHALLTPDQQAKAKELRAKHGRPGENRRGGGPQGDRPQGDRPGGGKPERN